MFTAPRYRNSPHDEQFRAPGILAKAGVPLSIGFRLGGWTAANQRNLPYHAAHAVAHGLSREKALASITIEPANSPEYPSVSAPSKSGRKQLSSPPRGTCSTFAPPSNTWSLPGKKQACKAGTPGYTSAIEAGPSPKTCLSHDSSPIRGSRKWFSNSSRPNKHGRTFPKPLVSVAF